jgi:hypothetical protein
VTGVGTAPKDFAQFQTWVKKKIVALERRGGGSNFVLPDRLAPGGQVVTDWNNATEDGWYYSTTGASANAPFNAEWVGHVQNNITAGRLVQRLTGPYGNPNGDVEWVRVKSGTTWFAWRRADGKVNPVSVGGTTADANYGRYMLTAASTSWFFSNHLVNYRAWRVTWATQSTTAHRPCLRFLSGTGTTQVTTSDYLSSDWDPNGHAANTGSLFYLAKGNAVAHTGEFLITNAQNTAANTPTEVSGKTYSRPGSQTIHGGVLQNYNTTALGGFVLYLDSSAAIEANAGSFVMIQGIA